MIHTDNGTEFFGATFTGCCAANGIIIDYIEPGIPNRSAYIEGFNRSYRTEVLDVYLFTSLDEAQEIAWQWMQEYNEERGHDARGKLTPTEFHQQAGVSPYGVSTWRESLRTSLIVD